ncbi:anaphase promoting complex subunit 8/cdc23 family protein [Aphelenchoides avenae]|nr:anaphase promoting complex subunit 8/cdc23 family protein [Aphelenchus avenae]
MDVTTYQPDNIAELYWLVEECDQRCLHEYSKWTNEVLCHIPEIVLEDYEQSDSYVAAEPDRKLKISQRNVINFAKSLINSKEYRRAKFYMEKIKRTSPLEHFLYYFSWYLISLRDRHENEAEEEERQVEFADAVLAELRRDIERFKRESPESFDCFLNYLLGLIRRDNCGKEDAIKALKEAIAQDHRCWPAWDLLASLANDYLCEEMEQMHEDRWECNLFIAESVMRRKEDFKFTAEAYTSVVPMIGPSPYLVAQIAVAWHEAQDNDTAVTLFERLRTTDPYRIEQMNIYSDILFLRRQFTELAMLAKACFESHRYRWETCCIVANYYSVRHNHTQAQEFLKRGTRLNPYEPSTWVLLGNEYLESKNHRGAVSAFRKAVVVDPRAFRAWYGLGQLYEVLQQPTYALYHYQKAHKVMPRDSRVLIALGVIYEKLRESSNSEKCYMKAIHVGDIEGGGLIRLGRLYERQNKVADAVEAYVEFLNRYANDMFGDPDAGAASCLYVAKYYLSIGGIELGEEYANRCIEFDKTKEEASHILRETKTMRREQHERETTVPSGFAAGLQSTDGNVNHSTPTFSAAAGAHASQTLNRVFAQDGLSPFAPTVYTPENLCRPNSFVATPRPTPAPTPRRPNHDESRNEEQVPNGEEDMVTSEDDDIDVSF